MEQVEVAARKKTSFQQRYENDIRGLIWVDRFGWIRSLELSRLMWPKDSHGRAKTDRVIRGWIERKLVIVRKLPDGAGRAITLSETGARLLRGKGDAFEHVRSGKDWGSTNGGQWTPNLEWKHDLFASGVLTLSFLDEWKIIPERVIQQENKNLKKIPDGLLWRDGKVMWLEVENTKKQGKRLRFMANALCDASQTGLVVCGHKTNSVLVAFDPFARDDRGFLLNHKSHVTTAIKKVSKSDVKVTWGAFTTSGCGVESLTLTPSTIPADLASKILEVMNNGGWREDSNGCFVANHGQHQGFIWYDPDQKMWSRSINNECAEYIGTKEEAKRSCAEEIAKLH